MKKREQINTIFDADFPPDDNVSYVNVYEYKDTFNYYFGAPNPFRFKNEDDPDTKLKYRVVVKFKKNIFSLE